MNLLDSEKLSIDAYCNIFTEMASKRTDMEKDIRKILESWTPPTLKDTSPQQQEEIENEIFAKIKIQIEGQKYDESMVRLEIGNWTGREYIRQMGGFRLGPPPDDI